MKFANVASKMFLFAGILACCVSSVSAQTVTTRTFAIISSASDHVCIDLLANKVRVIGVLGTTGQTAGPVTNHPISSICGGVSRAGETFHQTDVLALVRQNVKESSVWFLGDAPATGEIAFPQAGYQTFSCYAKEDTYGNILFSGSATGMSWHLCFFEMDFISF